MAKEFFPLYSKPGLRIENSWIFYEPEGEIEIDSDLDAIQHILHLSNGRSSVEEVLSSVSETSGVDSEKLERIINDLRILGVLSDRTEYMKVSHGYTNNPTLFNPELTENKARNLAKGTSFTPREGVRIPFKQYDTVVSDISKRRESCRDFMDKPVSLELIGTCIDAAYSKDRPTPSAGSLYPLRFYALVRNSSDDIPSGFYQYDHTSSEMIGIADSPDWEKMKFIFNNESLVYNAPVIFVITADLDRQAKKYGNRGYRYTNLEAGHSAQNIHLAAQELGLSSLEYGGFQDDKLAEELGLEANEKPLISVGVGYGNRGREDSGVETYEKIEEYVGKAGPVSWVKVDVESAPSKLMNFFHAYAQYSPTGRPQDLRYTSGLGRSIEIAKTKAIAEAVERFSASKVRWDVESAATDLKEPWLSPQDFAPLTKEQFARASNVHEFDTNEYIQWIRAEQNDGQTTLLPIDLVFYPINSQLIQRGLVADITSSGMAAHPNKDTAVKKALLELVERDAIMKYWLNRTPPPKVQPDSLTRFTQNRIDFWKSQGRTLDVLDISNEAASVALATIRNSQGEYPAFVSGASASETSFAEAAQRACEEAENLYILAENMSYSTPIRPQEVRSPEDHGRFYYFGENLKYIRWLWEGENRAQPAELTPINLLDKYNPFVVELSQDAEYLKVVRVLCPDLVPISFGFGNEYYSHKAVGLVDYNPAVPHFFA
jgi:thiazole/oxazole-forming peptide maturase SagD family component